MYLFALVTLEAHFRLQRYTDFNFFSNINKLEPLLWPEAKWKILEILASLSHVSKN
jgi:hypothetical protein